MKTVILCGGYGTRIRDVADDIPKPMIPIGGLPILWHIMKYYSVSGFDKFCLCLGYKGSSVKDFFINYEANTRDFTLKLDGNKPVEYHSKHSESNWEITMAETGIDSFTGARVKKIQKYVEDEENFMLTYGDGLSDVDLAKLVKFHKDHGKILTVTGVRPPGRFGEIMSDDKGLVTEFNEKPQATAGRISGGFFVCKKEIFKYLNNNDDLVFEKEPIRKLVQDKQMAVFEHDGFWQPMDTSRDYIYLKGLYEKGGAPWVKWGK